MTELVTTPYPVPAPLVRTCRDVITTAGQVAQVIATDPAAMISRIAAVDPRLGTALGHMTDAVMELDYRTEYLVGLPTLTPRRAY